MSHLRFPPCNSANAYIFGVCVSQKLKKLSGADAPGWWYRGSGVAVQEEGKKGHSTQNIVEGWQKGAHGLPSVSNSSSCALSSLESTSAALLYYGNAQPVAEPAKL